MDTDRPLEELRLQNWNRPIVWFYESSFQIDMDAPYQRGHVWSETQRRNLIRSLLRGLPIGAIFVNVRPDDLRSNTVYGHCVDGKQRATTIAMFGRGELAVPASWFPRADVLATETVYYEDGSFEGVRFTGLAERQQRFFGNTPTAVYESHLPDVDGEWELYQLINFGGVPQNADDEARAKRYEARFSQAADFLENRSLGLSLYGALAAAAERAGGGAEDVKHLVAQFEEFIGMPLYAYEVGAERMGMALDLRRAAAEVWR